MTDDDNAALHENGVRINRYISSSGDCSRREADTFVAEGIVTIDGNPAEPGSKVLPGQVVKVGGEPILPDENLIYIALNKPLGITCTTDRRDESNVIDYLGMDKRVFPIGRLDKMSTGLLLLTNDGAIVNRLLRAEGRHEKEYLVEVNKPLTEEFISAMQSGVPILDTVTLPCKVIQVGPSTFRILLTQGLNRQIRRMCEYLGYSVRRLKRTRILNIDLGTLPMGEWRRLTMKEIRDLKALTDPTYSKARRRSSRDTSSS